MGELPVADIVFVSFPFSDLSALALAVGWAECNEAQQK